MSVCDRAPPIPPRGPLCCHHLHICKHSGMEDLMASTCAASTLSAAASQHQVTKQLCLCSCAANALTPAFGTADMPTVEEEAATEEVLARLTLQHSAQPDSPNTHLTTAHTVPTTQSGVMSPFQEQSGSNHPARTQTIALAQQRISASQVRVKARHC